MLLKDMTTIYLTSKQASSGYGQTDAKYIELRSFRANVQYGNNAEEQKSYGNISDRNIVIRIPNAIKAEIGDGIYLSEPAETDGGYDIPEYHVESIRTAYIGVASIRNPTILTGVVNNDKRENQAQGQSE